MWGKRLASMAFAMACGSVALLLPHDLHASLVGEPPSSGSLCESSPAGGATICLQSTAGGPNAGGPNAGGPTAGQPVLGRAGTSEIWLPLPNATAATGAKPGLPTLPAAQGGLAQPLDFSLEGSGPAHWISRLTSDDLLSGLFAETRADQRAELIFGAVMPLTDFISKSSQDVVVQDGPSKATGFMLLVIAGVALVLLLYCNALIFAKYLRDKKRASRPSKRRRPATAAESGREGLEDSGTTANSPEQTLEQTLEQTPELTPEQALEQTQNA